MEGSSLTPNPSFHHWEPAERLRLSELRLDRNRPDKQVNCYRQTILPKRESGYDQRGPWPHSIAYTRRQDPVSVMMNTQKAYHCPSHPTVAIGRKAPLLACLR